MANPKTCPKRPRRRDPWPLALTLVALVLVCCVGVALEWRVFGTAPKQEPVASASVEPEQATLRKVGEATASDAEDAKDSKDAKDSNDAEADGKDGATAAEEGETAAEPQEPAVEEAQVDLMMIGDILMHDELVQAGNRGDGTYNYDFIYRNIKPWIDEADLRILNQETVMGEPERGFWLHMGAAGPIMNSPTALADAEAAAGFNCILKATNHTLDLGYSGLAHELDYWQATYPNIPVIGVNNPNKAGTDDQSQNWVDNVYVVDTQGMKVAILNYTWATNENVEWEGDHRVISYMSEEKIRSDVEKARAAGAEMIVACPHWGLEYHTEPSEEEYHYGKVFCDAGVDVIFGCHPHILQGAEVLVNEQGHKTVCFYSVGNFVAASIMEAYSMIGGIARVTLTRGADGTYAVTAASMIPTVICHSDGETMSAYPLAAWTQELCDIGRRPQLTPQWCYDFCQGVLGEGFDPNLGFYILDVTQPGRPV